MRKIYFAGDHSRLHCGCQAVVAYIKSIFKDKDFEFVKKLDDADLLVVNGEGTMHHTSSGFKKKMNLIQAAQASGKKTYLINTVWEKNSNLYDSVLMGLDGFIVRESASQLDLVKNHGLNADVRLDFSYFCELKEVSKYKNLNGSKCLTDFYSSDFGGWVKYSGGAISKYPYLKMNDFSWSEFVKTLSTSSLLITGRHHAVFAACKARTPFVALESNTHKISGFVRMSNIPIPVCDRPSQLGTATKWAEKNKNAYSDFFDFLEEQPKFILQDIGL